MCGKRFTFATFVRQLLTSEPARFHASLMALLK